MEPKEIIAQIKALLKVDVKLLEATPHPDLISSVMAIKEDCIKYAAEDNELIGLNLARTKLTDQQWQEILDIEKFDPGKLQALNLSGNKLQSIKLSAAFTALKSLEISDNETLVSFSFEAGLPNLGRLTLRDNKLRKLDLPKGFSALKYLDVSRNELQGVDFQGDMPGLVWMELSENKLGKLSLPSGFNSLRYLFCIKSQLKELHFNSPLENLDMLQLRGNELNKMPENFLQLTSLKTLFVHGNPLSTIPPEFIAEGEDDNSLEKIRTYLQSLFEDESIPNDEVKLILLGNSTAGKSSLLRYLRKRKYDDKLPSTHGIFNRIWEIPGKNFKVNVWDFGGQEFYHATHRLFLSNNTVSLIVFEQATNGQMIKPSKIKLYYNGALVEKEIPLEHFPFTYWLDNVQYFCQEVNSDATLLVQSKMDIAGTSKIRISDVDVEKYAINDENMLTVSVEGTSTGQAKFIRSFDDFEEQLLETLEKTKRTYDFSTKWLEIKNELRERGKTQFKFSYKEYIDFCDKIRPDIDKPGEEGTSTMLDLLTDYLHDIGVILYYKEITELKDTVFLNPQKVTDIIYKILDYAVMEEDGKFDIGHVNAVAQGIKKDGIEIEAKDIIALMKQFDLIFPVKNRLGQFVAPQYLPEDIGGGKKAYNRFKEKPNCIHAFTLYYPRFLPRSVISRVICHFGNLSNDDYWKNGILFSKQSTDCLIEAFNDEKIKVELSSESLSLINEIFDKIYQVSGKNAEVQISLDGKSFVAIKKLLTHPFQNPIITATNGEELLYESFIERGILLG
ncbi:MAG: internalin A, partial [Nitrospinales bacterium]